MSEEKEKAAEKEVVEQEAVQNEEATPVAEKDTKEEVVEAKEDPKAKVEAKEEVTEEAPAVEEAKEEVAEEAPKAEVKKEDKEKPAKAARKKVAAPKAEAEEKEEATPAKPKSYLPANESEEEILKMDEPTDDFDWDSDTSTGFSAEYQGSAREQMEEEYTSSLNTITEKEVVKATVVGLNNRDVILNIGFKSDGLVSATEFRDIPDLKIGDEVEIYIEEQENANGQLILSRRKAKIVNAWDNIKNGYENDLVIEGVVKRRTKGGLIVDIFGVEAFLPGSQIDVKPIRDFDVFVNKKMEVKVVKINYTNDNVVVSHKVLIEKDLEKQKAEILNNLEKGQVLEGVIKNMTNFGVFIDLGGVDGLLHITDISWGRINHPEDVLNLDDTVKIVVLDFDEDKKRISLGMKQLTAHPWDALAKDLDIGSKVTGKIVNVADYGAFLEISPGVEGLIHVSEMSWSQHLRNPSDFLNVGDEKEAVVITLDRDERKMSLGIKQLSEDPWTKQDVLSKYGIGTTHKGVVRNLTNFGLFIELEEGIDGLVHVSDLSWTKKIKHPSEFINVGDELEVKVLELDVDNRRLALGHKQLEDNPWDTFADVFTVGSVHKCTVISKIDKGAVLELPYGLEGYANNRQLEKEDGTSLAEGDSSDFKVLEFSKDDKRIVLSHTATFKEEKSKPAPQKPKASAVEKVNKKT
jgi:small subunit ribosomal protein S1